MKLTLINKYGRFEIDEADFAQFEADMTKSNKPLYSILSGVDVNYLCIPNKGKSLCFSGAVLRDGMWIVE